MNSIKNSWFDPDNSAAVDVENQYLQNHMICSLTAAIVSAAHWTVRSVISRAMDPDLYLVDPDRARRSSSATEASDRTRLSRVEGPREEQQRPRQVLAAAASSCRT